MGQRSSSRAPPSNAGVDSGVGVGVGVDVEPRDAAAAGLLTGLRALAAAATLGATVLGVIVACNAILGVDEVRLRKDAPQDAGYAPDTGYVPDAGDAGCRGDLACDPDNCGRRGHGCLGGACQSGACQPIVLASGQRGPRGLAVHRGTVYWANGGWDTNGLGAIMACATAGCDGGPTPLANPQSRPIRVVADDIRIYWTVAGKSVQTCMLSTKCGVGEPTTLSSGLTSRFSLALASGYLYWASNDKDGGAVMRLAIRDIGIVDAAPAPIVSDRQAELRDIAVDATNSLKPTLYWIEADSDAGTAALMTCTLDERGTCAPGTLLAHLQGPQRMVVDARTVYVSETDDGKIVACPISGCGDAGTLLGRLDGPLPLLVEGAMVYFAESNGGTVGAVPTDGGTPVTIAAGQNYPFDLALDDDAIYWTDRGDVDASNGALMKVARP